MVEQLENPGILNQGEWAEIGSTEVVDVYEVNFGGRTILVCAETHFSRHESGTVVIDPLRGALRRIDKKYSFFIEGAAGRGLTRDSIRAVADRFGKRMVNLPGPSEVYPLILRERLLSIEDLYQADFLYNLNKAELREDDLPREPNVVDIKPSALLDTIHEFTRRPYLEVGLRGLDWLAFKDRIVRDLTEGDIEPIIDRANEVLVLTLARSNQEQARIITNHPAWVQDNLFILLGRAHLGTLVSAGPIAEQSLARSRERWIVKAEKIRQVISL